MRAWSHPRVAREVLVFAAIGLVSTAAYGALYLLLRQSLTPAAANALALLVTAIGNTAANRRLTFRVRSRGSMLRDQLGGLLALGIALAITTASIGALDTLVPHAARPVELAVLLVANALATIVRFLVLRTVIAGHPIPTRATFEPDQLWSRS